MRVLIDVSVPVEAGNAAIKDGRLPKTIAATVDLLRPEAAYFYPESGKRHAFFVAELKESSQIPAVVERLFEELNAEVTITPVMNFEELKKGLAQIGVGK